MTSAEPTDLVVREWERLRARGHSAIAGAARRVLHTTDYDDGDIAGFPFSTTRRRRSSTPVIRLGPKYRQMVRDEPTFLP
jgi:hypothetical protein